MVVFGDGIGLSGFPIHIRGELAERLQRRPGLLRLPQIPPPNPHLSARRKHYVRSTAALASMRKTI